jgi:hypothetical protein|tara:strand:- start:2199 stop:2390 length:192 start_codon:yes stop_codon:yes gene_type:complete
MTNNEKTAFDWTDWVERSVWTAVEAGLAVMVVTDISTWKAAGAAALAAGIAAVKTLAKARLNK